MKKKFLIFSQSRSGSTLLKELLDSHPSICCEGEILALTGAYINSSVLLRIVRRVPISFIYYHKSLTHLDVYGFTLFSYHIPNLQFYLPLLNRLGWKIIYLKRRSIINQTLSTIIANKKNHFHTRKSRNLLEQTVLKISIEEFVESAKKRIQRHEKEDKFLKKCTYLTIFYEDDLEDEMQWAETAEKVFNYLNVGYWEVTTNLKKTYSVPYSQLVENYDELERVYLDLTK